MRNLLALLLVCLSISGSPGQSEAREVALTHGLIIRSAPGFPDNIAGKDPIEAALVSGSWHAPKPGDSIQYNDTLKGTWAEVQAESTGWFDHPLLSGAYLYFELDLPKREIAILQPMGNSIAYVNGVPRAGNPYGMKDAWEPWEPRFNYALLPVELRAGKNWFLFHCARGRFKASLILRGPRVFLNMRDCTLPDIIEGRKYEGSGAVVVVNATEKPLRNLRIGSSLGENPYAEVPVPLIQPMSVRKVRIPVICSLPAAVGSQRLTIRLGSGKEVVDTAGVSVRVVRATDARKETFVSGIDSSVQYYALLPAMGDETLNAPALILSLHGASVEAINQANSYSPKTWAHIVCPTNRRPYGFNWEDWGRSDALEVLALARNRLHIDESRIYLTGHSMGGHGTYHLGSLFPDQFAAIGPSAGWISFWTYRVREKFEDPSPMRQMLMRPTLASDTYALACNYSGLGVYILHGSADDNVPVDQSRAMAEHLSAFQKDFVYDEQPGVGHWWDKSDEPGADCVDWPPMFDFFARHARPEDERLREVHFATPSPGVSSRYYWASIEAQMEQWKISRIDLRLDPRMRRVVGKTENVRRMTLRLQDLLKADSVTVVLDGQRIAAIPWPPDGELHLQRSDGLWHANGSPSGTLKGPVRSGTFRDAIRNNVVFVYGTNGSARENQWAFAKARFDAERFWYQGNGSVEVLADTQCTISGVRERNVVVYGNAKTHRLWRALLEDSPVQVSSGKVSIGGKVFKGEDISCIFVRPRQGSDRLSIGVVSGTGLTGMRGTNRMPYLLPGIGFPDLLVSRASSYTQGEGSVLGAGFFGDDWSLENGEFVWKER
jgi:hypothetical protein